MDVFYLLARVFYVIFFLYYSMLCKVSFFFYFIFPSRVRRTKNTKRGNKTAYCIFYEILSPLAVATALL